MRHLLLIYYEPTPSGQSTHVLSLVERLPRERYRLTLVLPDRILPALRPLLPDDIEVVPLPLRKLLWGPGVILPLRRLIRRRQIDLIHVHSQEAGLPMRLIAPLIGGRSPLLYTPQTIDIRRKRWHWLYLGLERLLAPLTDRIISVNEADRQRLLSLGIAPAKVVTIPNGIDLSRFTAPGDPAELRRSLGLDIDRPLVMQVGRLTAQKDPLMFVAGAARVLREIPQAQFAMIGEGVLHEEVADRIAELGLSDQIRLLGWRDEAFRLMPAADIITLTSRWEGTPYTLLEAMAWARPVVATAVNGCPEVVEDGLTGYLVPPGDSGLWAEKAIILLHEKEKAAEMGRQGRRRVEEIFSVERMAADVEALYRSLG